MAKHRTQRTHSIAFKRQVVQEYLAGETLHGLARRHELARTLIRIWVDKYEAGAFDEDIEAASTIQEYEARIAAPAGGKGRTITKKGIRLDSAYYIAGPLGSRVGERVRLRRDPADRGRIHVYREDGSFLCVAENPAVTGADQAAIAGAMNGDYRSHRNGARKRARDVIRRRDPDGIAKRVLDKAAASAAGVVAFPKPGQAHKTQALTQAGLAAKAAGKADKADKAASAPDGGGMSPTLAAAGALFVKDEEWA